MTNSSLEVLCRLCLSNEGKMENIFCNDNGLQDKIYDCTSIEILNIDGIPGNVCEFCKSNLIIAYRFRTQCIRSNNLLHKQYKDIINAFNKQSNRKFEKGTQTSIEDNIEKVENVTAEIKSIKKPKGKRKVSSYSLKIEEIDEGSQQLLATLINDELLNSIDEVETQEVLIDNAKTDHSLDKIDDMDDDDDKESEKCLSETDIHKVTEYVTRKKSQFGNRRKRKLSDTLETRYKIVNGEKITYHKICQICGKMQQNLRQHMLVHTGEKKHECPYCGKGFSQRGNFNHHVNIHTGNKPYNCSLCEKTFCDPNSRKSHMVTHTGEKNYHCEICGNSFGYSHTLAAHRRTHSQERKHVCNFCDKPFLTKYGLKKHVRIHTGEKPYQCEFCSKGFTSSGNLSTHRRIHTKERPYKCTLCEMDFAYRSVLNSHMKVHSAVAATDDNTDTS